MNIKSWITYIKWWLIGKKRFKKWLLKNPITPTFDIPIVHPMNDIPVEQLFYIDKN